MFKKKAAAKKEHHEKKEHKAKKHHKAKKEHSKEEKVMKEFYHNKLHSGSKKGPLVTNKKQGIAIALNESRKAGAKIPKKKK